MNYLFIDTTSNLIIGLLSEEFKWLAFEELDTNKTSEVIHARIFEILGKNNLGPQDNFEIFSLCGPGSYTGMRISEGVNQIFEMEGKKVYSFASFEIIDFLKISWTHWCYPAFKSEVYIRNKNGEGKLVSQSDFVKEYVLNNDIELVTYGAHFLEHGDKIFNSRALLKEKSGQIFSEIKRLDLRHEPFYFRPLDVEFKQKS